MLDAIRKITLYVHDPEAALRFWTEQCHFVKRADHRMGPVRWLERLRPASSFTTRR